MIETYSETPRTGNEPDAVDGFIARHFSLKGTIRLHRHALGFDLLRAPLNVVLAPVYLLVRLVAISLTLAGARRIGAWLVARRVLLRTAVAQALEKALCAELIGPGPPSAAEFRHIDDYISVRNAISEMLTTALVLVAGFAVFRNPTPGILSLAPLVSRSRAETTAVANFPLGQGLGRAWYGLFPVELPIWYVVAIGLALAMTASLVTTFAGVLADPVQARLGIHRRRLMRLLAKLEDAGDARPTLAREHLFARLADVSDAALSLLRIFRP